MLHGGTIRKILPRRDHMAASDESPKKVEEITSDQANTFLHDEEFLSENRLNRVYAIVRDPKDPNLILAMTVMERA
jgi:hypothetical protein